MSYQSPVIARIYNKTDNSFGILIQGEHQWMYPKGIATLYYDPMSACFPKEEANLMHLVSSGVVSVEVLINRQGAYQSCGFYDFSRPEVQKKVEAPKVEAVKEDLITVRNIVDVVEDKKAEDSFGPRKVEPEPAKPTVDPFNVPEKVEYQTPKGESTPVKQEPVIEVVSNDSPVMENIKRNKKGSK